MDATSDSLAVVIGAGGAIGSAVASHLRRDPRYAHVIATERGGESPVDVRDEASLAALAARIAEDGRALRFVFVATGFLHGEGMTPEKSIRQLDPAALAYSFAVNAIGPALAIKHLTPLFPRSGRVTFAVTSARAGSIGENRIGGWFGYRAAKAALNQLVRSAAAELARSRKEAVVVALHPGHVESRLSAPFGAGGNETFTPDQAAENLLRLLDALTPADSGGFYAPNGERIPW
jgi:NAD(P)-dependent dehydrogenase (short-subunit alcohol dehydrogenase family)